MENNKNNMLINTPGTNLRPQTEEQSPMYQTYMAPNMTNNMAYRLVYPELFYRLQPFVLMVCDEMDAYGPVMPTQEMIEQLSDGIYDDVCRMYPDVAEYAGNLEKNRNPEQPPGSPVILNIGNPYFYGGRGISGHRFRQRGMFRDLIDILLISELFRRRRRIY